MKILADYHMHTHNSGDSEAPMKDMIDTSISCGLKSICFTEHMDIDYPEYPQDNITSKTFLLDADSYSEEFNKFKTEYQDKLDIHFGVEIGLQPHLVEQNTDFISKYPFEFIIASNHICNHKDPYYPEFYIGRSEKEAMSEFFESTLENVKLFDEYDVFGHLDYAVRYTPSKGKNYSYQDHKDIIDEILKIIVSKGKGLDVNTKSLYSGMNETNPCTDILKRFKELGGEIITFGSDAHKPQDISREFDKAAQIVLDAGFKYYCTFDNRKALYHTIE